ncbi:hypothetical protein A2U01_0105724, partial [Trifolium medium]|nr:hypothetical protein [Trifolium medium]
EESVKAEEEEKRRKEEEEKRLQEEKLKLLSVNESPEDKGQSAYEHDPLVLQLQEQLAAQKAEQEKIKEDVKN